LARHIADTTYDSLPAEEVRAAKDVILKRALSPRYITSSRWWCRK
jgi:hypothetical protein